MYVSKLAGLSFDIKGCHKSWSKEKVRCLKISFMDDMLRWRTDDYSMFLLDVSSEKDYKKIILIGKNLNGYYNINRLFLNGGARFDATYNGPYFKSMKDREEEAKESKQGLFDQYDEKWLNRITPKGFNLEEFIEGPPAFLGEWKPTPKEVR